MVLAHAVGMSDVRKRLLEKTGGQRLIKHLLLTTVVAIGFVGAMKSEQTVLNARTASMTSSVAASQHCRPGVSLENDAPTVRCATQAADNRRSDR